MEQWTGLIKVVNRVNRALSITYDGKSITVPPLGSVMVPPIVADRGLSQNPLMGSEDPYNPSHFESLLGVPDWNTPCDPIDAKVVEAADDKGERIDRTLLPPEAQTAKRVKFGREKPARAPGVIDGGDVHFDGR